MSDCDVAWRNAEELDRLTKELHDTSEKLQETQELHNKSVEEKEIIAARGRELEDRERRSLQSREELERELDAKDELVLGVATCCAN